MTLYPRIAPETFLHVTAGIEIPKRTMAEFHLASSVSGSPYCAVTEALVQNTPIVNGTTATPVLFKERERPAFKK